MGVSWSHLSIKSQTQSRPVLYSLYLRNLQQNIASQQICGLHVYRRKALACDAIGNNAINCFCGYYNLLLNCSYRYWRLGEQPSSQNCLLAVMFLQVLTSKHYSHGATKSVSHFLPFIERNVCPSWATNMVERRARLCKTIWWPLQNFWDHPSNLLLERAEALSP